MRISPKMAKKMRKMRKNTEKRGAHFSQGPAYSRKGMKANQRINFDDFLLTTKGAARCDNVQEARAEYVAPIRLGRFLDCSEKGREEEAGGEE